MASLVYNLNITRFKDSMAAYSVSDPGIGGPVSIAVIMPAADLVAEFGQVPATISVVIREEPDASDAPPAREWLEALPYEAQP